MDDSKTAIVRFPDYYQDIEWTGQDALFLFHLSGVECPLSGREASH